MGNVKPPVASERFSVLQRSYGSFLFIDLSQLFVLCNRIIRLGLYRSPSGRYQQ